LDNCLEERKRRAGKRESKKKEENQQEKRKNSVKPSSNLVRFERWCGRDWTIIKTRTTHRWSR
jgi:hypothetical protein